MGATSTMRKDDGDMVIGQTLQKRVERCCIALHKLLKDFPNTTLDAAAIGLLMSSLPVHRWFAVASYPTTH